MIKDEAVERYKKNKAINDKMNQRMTDLEKEMTKTVDQREKREQLMRDQEGSVSKWMEEVGMKIGHEKENKTRRREDNNRKK